jgi:hypothetical protein
MKCCWRRRREAKTQTPTGGSNPLGVVSRPPEPSRVPRVSELLQQSPAHPARTLPRVRRPLVGVGQSQGRRTLEDRLDRSREARELVLNFPYNHPFMEFANSLLSSGGTVEYGELVVTLRGVEQKYSLNKVDQVTLSSGALMMQMTWEMWPYERH